MKRTKTLVLVTLFGCAMSTCNALADEIPAWFRARLASSSFCAVCDLVDSDTQSPGKEWKWEIVRIYRGNQAILDKTPVFKSAARLMTLSYFDGKPGPPDGNSSLLFACRGRVPIVVQQRDPMPLLNRRTDLNPDGSMVSLGLSREETTNYYSMLPVEDGAVRISINEDATGFDVPQARIPLTRIAALFQKRHRGRRADSTAHGRRPAAMSHR